MKKKNKVYPLINYSSLNYKNTNFLKKFIATDGKIIPKYITILDPKNHKKLSKSVKVSRILGLLKFINN